MKLFRKPKVVEEFTLTWHQSGVYLDSDAYEKLDMNYGDFSLGNWWRGGRIMLDKLGKLSYLGSKVRVTMEIIK